MKGQAATEYLIILAVVVIIALIVIGVMGGFPGITRGISERDSAAYWAGADIGLIRYSLVVTGSSSDSTLVFRNNKNFQVRMTNISFDGTNTTGFPVEVIAPGASVGVNITSTDLDCGSASAGQSFSRNVVIYYTDPQYGNAYTFTGEKPLVGTCQ